MEINELLKKVRRIELKTRKRVNNLLLGEYHSAFKGKGLEFSEVRQYQPGDDIRLIDWNVTARSNEAYVKVNHEERELTIYLLVDVSGSMYTSSKRQLKKDIAAEIAATFAYSASVHQDRIGLITFSDEIHQHIKPEKGKKQTLLIIRDLLKTDFPKHKDGSNIEQALKYVNQVMRRRGIIVLITDFLSKNYQTPLNIISKRHHVIPIWLQDDMETALPKGVSVMFKDAETKTLTPHIATFGPWYKKTQKKLHNIELNIENTLRKCGLKVLKINTGEDPVFKLIKYLKK